MPHYHPEWCLADLMWLKEYSNLTSEAQNSCRLRVVPFKETRQHDSLPVRHPLVEQTVKCGKWLGNNRLAQQGANVFRCFIQPYFLQSIGDMTRQPIVSILVLITLK